MKDPRTWSNQPLRLTWALSPDGECNLHNYERLTFRIKSARKKHNLLGTEKEQQNFQICVKNSPLLELAWHNYYTLGWKLTNSNFALCHDTAKQCSKCGTAERHKQVLMNMYHLKTHMKIELLVGELNAKWKSCSLSNFNLAATLITPTLCWNPFSNWKHWQFSKACYVEPLMCSVETCETYHRQFLKILSVTEVKRVIPDSSYSQVNKYHCSVTSPKSQKDAGAP